ncbi:MAG: hypothetical protein MUC48_20195 [Leptolyngbya sp. Prado105]|jgi:hypothetical protein|nr:hypothetical protein [Leptolyngbya sp. Prado105]
MSWKLYEIDRRAQALVLKFRDTDVLGESHKMRMTTAYGLERFWGEHLRLIKTKDKANFWRETWKELCAIMLEAGIKVPNDAVNPDKTAEVQAMAAKLWDEKQFPIEQRKVALAVLVQLCDSLVWWTQRYKKPGNGARE